MQSPAMTLGFALGLPVVVSEHAVGIHWVFPADRFVAYEESDLGWAKALGFGREVWGPTAYLVNGSLIVHPDILEQLERQAAPEARP